MKKSWCRYRVFWAPCCQAVNKKHGYWQISDELRQWSFPKLHGGVRACRKLAWVWTGFSEGGKLSRGLSEGSGGPRRVAEGHQGLQIPSWGRETTFQPQKPVHIHASFHTQGSACNLGMNFFKFFQGPFLTCCGGLFSYFFSKFQRFGLNEWRNGRILYNLVLYSCKDNI